MHWLSVITAWQLSLILSFQTGLLLKQSDISWQIMSCTLWKIWKEVHVWFPIWHGQSSLHCLPIECIKITFVKCGLSRVNSHCMHQQTHNIMPLLYYLCIPFCPQPSLHEGVGVMIRTLWKSPKSQFGTKGLTILLGSVDPFLLCVCIQKIPDMDSYHILEAITGGKMLCLGPR